MYRNHEILDLGSTRLINLNSNYNSLSNDVGVFRKSVTLKVDARRTCPSSL